jgi:xylulokinase
VTQYVGIDIGTTNIKVACYDPGTKGLVAIRHRPTPFEHDQWGGRRDPEAVRRLVAELLADLAGDPAVNRSAVAAVAVCSMGEETVVVDSNGSPRGSALVWFGRHGHELKDDLREDPAFREVDASFSVFKLAWLAVHEPATFAGAVSFTSMADFVAAALSEDGAAKPFINTSLASRTGLLNLGRVRLERDLLDRLGLGSLALPELVASAAVVAPLGGDLFPNAVVVAGGHDHFCGAFGSDVRSPGDVYVSAGTSEAQFMLATSLPDDLAGFEPGLFVADGLVYLHRAIPSGRYYKTWLALLYPDVSPSQMWTELDPLLGEVAPAAINLDRHTIRFPALSADVSRAELMASLQAGLAAKAREVTSDLELATGQPARSVVVAGLATAEARWRQVRRRYMGKDIAFVDEPEATVLGVARLAEYALGRSDAASQGETR